MLPPLEHPCMGYVCGVPDGSIPGWSIWSCQDAGYYGNLAGCVDPRCTGWRPSIPGCGPQVWKQLESQDPNVLQPLIDPMILTGKSGCCCGSGANGGPGSGGGGSGVSSPADTLDLSPGAACCAGGGDLNFNFPWWILVLIVILVVRYNK